MSEYDDNLITFFGRTNFRGQETPFGIKLDDRRRHMYLLGKTGVGKTTLMETMLIQDIKNGYGACFVDPNGDSVYKILDYIPSHRVNDVIYFNPADLEFPLAFNILESVDPRYKHLVASGLMGIFTKLWAGVWSARMEYILNNTVLALLDSPGNTMLGIARMYVDKKYRKKIVDSIKDPVVRSFWVDEFANYTEKYRTEAIAPIQNKVGQFLSSAVIRNIVGQPKSTLDMRDVMDSGKILLVDLSKGKVGEDNSSLLGAMIITKLQLAALSRVDTMEKDRKDFFLYVDEFQNFVTDSVATILSEARKYRLNLTIGHQFIGQLAPDKNNTKVRDAVFGNVGSMGIFRIGAADAEYLETEFAPTFTPQDMINLPRFNFVCKLMINAMTSEPFTATGLPAPDAWRTGNRDKVIRISRERFGTAVASVEEKIMRWMGAEFHEGNAGITIGSDEDEAPATPKFIPKAPAPNPNTYYPPKNPIKPQVIEKPVIMISPEPPHLDDLAEERAELAKALMTEEEEEVSSQNDEPVFAPEVAEYRAEPVVPLPPPQTTPEPAPTPKGLDLMHLRGGMYQEPESKQAVPTTTQQAPAPKPAAPVKPQQEHHYEKPRGESRGDRPTPSRGQDRPHRTGPPRTDNRPRPQRPDTRRDNRRDGGQRYDKAHKSKPTHRPKENPIWAQAQALQADKNEQLADAITKGLDKQ